MKIRRAGNGWVWPLALGLALAACGEAAPPPSVASIIVRPLANTLVPGRSLELSASALDASGKTLNVPLEWTSSAPQVVSVSGGVVTGIIPGDATITAASGSVRGSLPVTVQPGGYISIAGGSAVSADGIARLDVSPGIYTGPGVAVTVTKVASPRTDFRLVDGSSYAFQAEGTLLIPTATFSIRFTRSAIPGGVSSAVRVHELIDTTWRQFGTGTVDTAAGTARSIGVGRSGTFGLLGQGPPARIEVLDSVSAGRAGAVMALPPRIRVYNRIDQRLVDAPVLFSIVQGQGTVGVPPGRTATASTNSDGVVTPPSWVLDPGAVLNRVTASAEPVAPVTLTSSGRHFHTIAVGFEHTCGIVVTFSTTFPNGGAAHCWGGNGRGQLGRSSAGSISEVPVPVSTDTLFHTVLAGGRHSCGATRFERWYCWGDNGFGQVGDESIIGRLAPVPLSPALLFVAPGGTHSCGVAQSGSLQCWGNNASGQLGDGTTVTSPMARTVPLPEYAVWIASGTSHSCALGLSGTAYCWGDWQGEGSQAPIARRSPQAVQSATGVAMTTLSAGGAHTCAVDNGSRAFCWGSNSEGQLGDGTTTTRSVPTPVATSLRFTDIAAGATHTCARSVDRSVWCWGSNSFGESGDGTQQRRLIPVQVLGGLEFLAIATGQGTSCGVALSTAAYCWGDNRQGQVGDASTTQRLAPTLVRLPPP